VLPHPDFDSGRINEEVAGPWLAGCLVENRDVAKYPRDSCAIKAFDGKP